MAEMPPNVYLSTLLAHMADDLDANTGGGRLKPHRSLSAGSELGSSSGALSVRTNGAPVIDAAGQAPPVSRLFRISRITLLDVNWNSRQYATIPHLPVCIQIWHILGMPRTTLGRVG